MADERTLQKMMTAGIIDRRDLEGTRHGIVKYNPDGTNPYGPNRVPVQLAGEAERASVIVPVIFQQYIKHNTHVWCKRNKRGKWKIAELDDDANENVSSGVNGQSLAGGKTHTRTPIGSGGTSITSLRYGGTGANLSAASDGEVVKSGSVMTTIKHNLTAVTDPTTSDNAAAGWGVKSLWINVTASRVWQYIKEAAGLATWKELTTPSPIALAGGGTGADLSAAINGHVVKAGSVFSTRAFNVSTSAPTVTDDNTDGYGVFSMWHHYDPGGGGEDDLYWCADASTGAARWEKYALHNHTAIFSYARADTLASQPATGDTFQASGAEVVLSRSDNTEFPELWLIRGRSSGTDPDNGDILAQLSGSGVGNPTSRNARIRAVATEDHGGTSQGAGWEIWTTKNTTNSSVKRVAISDLGKVTFTPDSTSVPINLTPAATPSSPVAGDYWADSTRQATGQNIGGLTHWHSGVIFVQTADGSAADTSSDEAMEGSGVGTLTIPANRLVAGSTIEAELWGRLNTDNSTNSRALVLTLKYDGVDIVNQAISFTNNYGTGNEPTGRSWHARFTLTVRTGGATGTLMASVWFQIDGLTPRLTNGIQVSSVDFTAAKALSFTGRWTSFASGDTATLKALRVNQLM